MSLLLLLLVLELIIAGSMCTVTYIPVAKEEYILTSNRDESPERGKVTILPEIIKKNNSSLISPIDKKAQGTWLLSTDNKLTLCILNGAFIKHKHVPPYRMSRGLIPFHFLDYPSTEKFCKQIPLEGIEPFTLVICEGGKNLSTLIWDGAEKHIQILDPSKPYIWSSATLYDEETKKYKENLFTEFINQNKSKTIDPLVFHTIGKDNIKEPSVFIKREKVETVSTSVVRVNKKNTTLFYHDYLKNENKKLTLH